MQVFGKVDLASGSTGKTVEDKEAKELTFIAPDTTAGGSMGRIRMEASGENDSGNFGGWIRFDGNNVSGWGYMWWQPSEMLKLTIGSNGGDNFFGQEGVTGWGFYQVAGDIIVNANNAWGGGIVDGACFRDAFYGGFDNGLMLSITPMEALEINIAVPLIEENGAKAEDVYKKTHAQVAYNIEDVGKFALTYVGNLNTLGLTMPTDPEKEMGLDANAGQIFAYFGLSMIENLGIDIGLGYTMAVSETVGDGATAVKVTYNTPIAAGLGVNFSADAFNVKARAMGKFAGSVKSEVGGKSTTADMPLVVLFDVLPSYAISDNLTFLCSIGIGFTGEYDTGEVDTENKKIMADSVMGWHVQPYITIKADDWFPNFYAGVRLESTGALDRAVKDGKEVPGATYINWSIPIGMAISF